MAMYGASDHKDWDTYLPSATYGYNTSLFKTTCDTTFFVLPMIQLKSVDYNREQLNWQIRTARKLAAECTQQTQQRMKSYYDQHAKDHPLQIDDKVWIYNPAVKPRLSKNYVPCDTAFFTW